MNYDTIILLTYLRSKSLKKIMVFGNFCCRHANKISWSTKDRFGFSCIADVQQNVVFHWDLGFFE